MSTRITVGVSRKIGQTDFGSSGNASAKATHRNETALSTNGKGQSRTREATDAQVRAIHAIASKANVSLASHLDSEFGVASPKQLTLRQASDLIEALKGRLDQTPA